MAQKSVSQIIAACARWAQNDLIYFVPVQNDLNGQVIELHITFSFKFHFQPMPAWLRSTAPATTLDFPESVKHFDYITPNIIIGIVLLTVDALFSLEFLFSRW